MYKINHQLNNVKLCSLYKKHFTDESQLTDLKLKMNPAFSTKHMV